MSWSRRVLRIFVLIALALVVVIPIAFAFLSYQSRQNPPPLGLVNGTLRDCVDERPNCVSSLVTGKPAIAPLAYVGDGRAATEQKLEAAIAQLGNAVVVKKDGNYWHVLATTAVFRFLDDVEFLFDDATGVVHVRSKSRAGYSDRGVNRRRVERIRAAM
jgi:uncharacterized protein (DUF1499 family)